MIDTITYTSLSLNVLSGVYLAVVIAMYVRQYMPHEIFVQYVCGQAVGMLVGATITIGMHALLLWLDSLWFAGVYMALSVCGAAMAHVNVVRFKQAFIHAYNEEMNNG